MTTPSPATPAQTQAVRDPAEVLISAEIRALMRKQHDWDQWEYYHRSCMINAQVEQLKLQALIDRYKDALRLVQYGAIA